MGKIKLARTAGLGVVVAAFMAAPALAVTVDNKTDKALEVTVDLGATEPKVKIDAGKSAKVDCPEGCEIRAVDLNSYGVTAKPGDKLTIKDGMLVFAEGTAGGKAEKDKLKTN